ncbi:hypothetical protein [uncultured Microbulbifer sp.]|uniref:hypothetical protein n=1 Tax=uncultured Microbulbifer sp. TaxID=348147 RepID=UPI00263449E6|nr:hypothetical protein [uncultured Microbulbifer sp.]
MKNKEFSEAGQAALDRLGLSDTPPLISGAKDTYSEAHRRNCLAWHLLCNRSRSEIGEWLAKQSAAMREDMRDRLNQLQNQVRQMRREAAQA